MRAAIGIRNASLRPCNVYLASRNRITLSIAPRRLPLLTNQSPLVTEEALRCRRRRFFSSTANLSSENADNSSHDSNDIEKIVRDAKQRFRDTLPSGYLNTEEYELYVRLYGPPLRETEPEDVGIHTHADMGSTRIEKEGTVLRPRSDGMFEELSYQLNNAIEQPAAESNEAHDQPIQVIEKAPGYVDIVARSQREHDAMQKLYLDFQAAQERQAKAAEEEAALQLEQFQQEQQEDFENIQRAEEEEGEALDNAYDDHMDQIDQDLRDEIYANGQTGEDRRFHPLTLQGRFHKPGPIVLELPRQRLIEPLTQMLQRTNPRHLREAVVKAYGGRGLPTYPGTVPGAGRDGNMGGVGLPADQRHMTEIEADVFVGTHIPPAYASTLAVLREVRRRVGQDWIQNKLKAGGPGDASGLSVLDAGGGGAGLLAWEQVLDAEWSLLKEKGEVQGDRPLGKQTVITGSDRLRHRVKTLFNDTTFLPRLPDYEHSAPTRNTPLDGGGVQQARKSYDIVIASHLFLKETEAHHRQAVLNNLWSLVKPDGGVLIVMEKAHPRGFEAVAHVRATLLDRYILPQSGEPSISAEKFNPAFHRELEPARILAPCTTHATCPLYLEQGRSKGRKDICHFSQRYVEPEFHAKLLGKQSNRDGEVEFSYIAIQRGVARTSAISPREATEEAFRGYEDNSTGELDMQTLPRLLMPALKRKGHVTMDMCTPEGKLERWTIPKSFGKLAYHDARKSHWGDLWALGAKTRVLKPARVGNVNTEKKARPPRKGDKMMDGVKLDVRERKVKHKDKKLNLIQDMLEAERQEEEELDWEIEQEIAADMDDDVHHDDDQPARRR